MKTEDLYRVRNRGEVSKLKKIGSSIRLKKLAFRIAVRLLIATPRNKRGHSTNTGKNTLERNRKSNDIHFELSNRFSALRNDDQNLTTK